MQYDVPGLPRQTNSIGSWVQDVRYDENVKKKKKEEERQSDTHDEKDKKREEEEGKRKKQFPACVV